MVDVLKFLIDLIKMFIDFLFETKIELTSNLEISIGMIFVVSVFCVGLIYILLKTFGLLESE